jgi:PAS domain S-box-containing protein
MDTGTNLHDHSPAQPHRQPDNLDNSAQPASEIARERDLLKGLIDELPDNIYVKDSEGRYILDNKAHRTFLCEPEESNIVGKTVFDFFPNELARRYHTDDQKIIGSGMPLLNREEPITGVSGSDKWVSTSKIPHFDDGGAVSRLVCISRDITDRKRYQDALTEMNAELERRVKERTAELNTANERLQAQIAQLREKARIDGELSAAKGIQRRLTPSFKPKIPRVNLKGVYFPAYEVGGDYLDYFQNAHGDWIVVIADVCGKGIPAALVMTMLRSTFRVEGRHQTSAKNLLCAVNDSISVTLDHRSFITALCCVISRDGSFMTCARAGHPPMIRLGAGAPQTVALQGIALGLILDGGEFRAATQEATIPLVNGDRFLLYTDGLTEAEGPDKDGYGPERLTGFLASARPADADMLVAQVIENVKQFSAGAPFRDDMTVCALQVHDF